MDFEELDAGNRILRYDNKTDVNICLFNSMKRIDLCY